MANYLGVIFTTIITVAIFSRVLRPNKVFRWAAYLLLGLGAGYTAAVVLKDVLLASLVSAKTLHITQLAPLLAALILALLLILRFSSSPQTRAWGLIPLGLMAGAGGALVLAGALRGSLLPQLMSPSHIQLAPHSFTLNVIGVVVATFVTLGVLIYLLPEAKASKTTDSETAWLMWILYGWRTLGYWALMLALGIFLASTAGARLTLLIERVQYLLHLWF